MAFFAFAALLVHLGAHVAIVAGLAQREPRWHAGVALLVPPLGVWWARRAGLRWRIVVWAASLGVYALALATMRL